MSKRKNPYQENESPTKKRKLDATVLDAAPYSSNNWCIKLTSTQNATGEEQQFSINNKKSFKVGRDPSCCCVINSPGVSREHCQFIYNTNNNQLLIKDLNSTNGVIVNDEKIDKNGSLTQLFHNDIIKFGEQYEEFNYEYRVEIIHNKYDNPFSTNNILSIEAMLQRIVEAQHAAHSKQMDQKLAAKDAETKRLKQCLLEKEMKELAEKNQQRAKALETKRKEIEKEMELEKLKQEKLKIYKEKKNAIKEARMKQEIELKKLKAKQKQKAKRQQIETQQKLEAIKAAQERLEFEQKKQENEMKSHRQRMDVEKAKIKQKEIALNEYFERIKFVLMCILCACVLCAALGLLFRALVFCACVFVLYVCAYLLRMKYKNTYFH